MRKSAKDLFFVFSSENFAFLSIKVTGGMLSKGLTPNQLGAAVSLFIFSSEDIRPCGLIQDIPVTSRKLFFMDLLN